MIRAVTRYTLEINKPSSPYFERAICFVKPEYAQNDRLDLHRAAQQLISALDAGVEEQAASDEELSLEAAEVIQPMGRLQILKKMLPMILSAAAGAGAALLLVLLL